MNGMCVNWMCRLTYKLGIYKKVDELYLCRSTCPICIHTYKLGTCKKAPGAHRHTCLECITLIFPAKDYGLSTSHSCAKCPADIHNYPYTQVTKDASWFTRCYTVDQFKLRFPDRCEVFDIPGVSHDTVGADTMHNKHLGMDVYFCGSVLYLLVYVMLPGVWGCS